MNTRSVVISLLILTAGLPGWLPCGAQAPGSKLWEFPTGAPVNSCPALGRNGTVYIGSSNGRLYALEGGTGGKLWDFYTGDVGGAASPSVDDDGTVFIGSSSGKLYALDGATGAKRWEFSTNETFAAPPAVGVNGTLYVVSGVSLYALDGTTGAQLWCWRAGDSGVRVYPSGAWPAVMADGAVLLPETIRAESGTLSVSDGTTGASLRDRWMRWPMTSSSPAIGADDRTVYLGGMLTEFYAIDGITMAQLWKVAGSFKPWEESPPVLSSPAVGIDGTVFVGMSWSSNGVRYGLCALDGTTGSIRWQFPCGDAQSSPAIAADGTVYFSSSDFRLHAVNGATGAQLWEYATGGAVTSSPVVGTDGTVYFGSADGSVYALRGTGPLAASSWPLRGATAQRTGRRPTAADPLSITTQPRKARLVAGQPGWLRVRCDGAFPRSYQWYFNGSPLAGATNAVLDLPTAQLAHAGSYRVTVSNAFNSVTSAEVLLAVVGAGAPEIRADGELLFTPETVKRGNSSVLTLSSTLTSAQIFYTLDGSAPTFASLKYSGPVTLSNTTTVRAVAYSSDFSQSPTDGPVVIQIVPAYTVSTQITGQGTVALSPAQGPYLQGASVTATATPAAGWRFARWQGDLSGASPSGTLTMDANKTITAVFEAIPQYALAAFTAGGGTVEGNTASPYYGGTTVEVRAVAANGWQFLYWRGDGAGNTTNLTVTMDRAKSVEAVFGTPVSTVAAGPGAVTLSPAAGPYPYGSTLVVSGVPQPGNYLALWGDAASGSANPLFFVVTNATPRISGLFAAIPPSQVLLTVSVVGEGTVTLDPPRTIFSVGEVVTLTAIPALDFAFSGWTGDSNSLASVLKVTMQQDTKLTATFSLAAPTIAVEPGDQTLFLGGSAVFTVRAQGGQPLAYRWRKDGADLTDAGRISGAASSTLVVANVGLAEEGGYTVRITNAVGSVTSRVAVLSILQNLVLPANGGRLESFTSQFNDSTWAAANLTDGVSRGAGFGWASPPFPTTPQEFVYSFKDHRAAQLSSVRVFSCGEAGLYYSKEIVLYGSEDRIVWSYITNAVLPWLDDVKIISFKPVNARYMKAVVPSGYNAAYWELGEIEVYGKLLDLPAITLQPQAQAVTVGASPSFSVNATGLAPLSYQWQHDGAPIALATNATLALSQVTVKDAGVYRVVVSNPGGSVTSDPATLTVSKAAAVVTLAGLSQVYDGTPKTVTATTTPPGLKVSLSYDGGSTGPVNAGIHSVTATITDDNYSGSASGILVIAQAGQTITFGPLPGKFVGDAPFTLGATASSGLPVAYSSSHPEVASVLGSVLTIQSAGTTVITAAQAGDGNYQAAAEVTQALVVTAPVPPQFAPGAMGLTQTGFRVVFTGTLGVSYVLEVSENLRQWTQLTQVMAGSGQTIVIDPNAVGKRQRYYRLRAADHP